MTYTLSQSETESGPYTEVVGKKSVPNKTTNLSNLITIPVGKTYYFKLVITLNYLSDVNQDEDITATFSSSFDLKDINYVEETFADKIAKDSNGVRINFDEEATTDEGIFEMEDDYGLSYYFRGAVENNYVKYGVNAAGKEMWWRIIRVNGDGSLRIVYDGTQGYVNGIASDDRFVKINQQYNAKSKDAKYVGWMYGPEGTTASMSKEQAQSNIESVGAKKVVDQWYKENIVDTGYGNNLSDEIFCNDRSTPGKELTGVSGDTGLGYGNNLTYYGALDYPVGLITADEIVAAGSGKYNTTNTKYYLYKPSDYLQWSLSPCMYGDAGMFCVNGVGNFDSEKVYYANGAVAPVINLSVKYASAMVGTGTITDPYRS